MMGVVILGMLFVVLVILTGVVTEGCCHDSTY